MDLGQGKPSNIEQRIGENMSVLNPTDMSMLKQTGRIDPRSTTVREYFSMLGIDVDGPLEQMAAAFKDQAEKADPVKKMQRIAGAPQGQAPETPPSGGLDSLLM